MSNLELNRGAVLFKLNSKKILDKIISSDTNEFNKKIILLNFARIMLYCPDLTNSKPWHGFINHSIYQKIDIKLKEMLNSSITYDFLSNVAKNLFISYKSMSIFLKEQINWKFSNVFLRSMLNVCIDHFIDLSLYPMLFSYYSNDVITVYGEKTYILKRMYFYFLNSKQNQTYNKKFLENMFLWINTDLNNKNFVFVSHHLNTDKSLFIRKKFIDYETIKNLFFKLSNVSLYKNVIKKLDIVNKMKNRMPKNFTIPIRNKFVQDAQDTQTVFLNLYKIVFIQLNHYYSVILFIDFAISDIQKYEVDNTDENKKDMEDLPSIVFMNRCSHTKIIAINLDTKKDLLNIRDTEIKNNSHHTKIEKIIDIMSYDL